MLIEMDISTKGLVLVVVEKVGGKEGITQGDNFKCLNKYYQTPLENGRMENNLKMSCQPNGICWF
jgi:hypothetical protein